MQAMVMERSGEPLKASRLPIPAPGPGEQLIGVQACGICRTYLHVVDGELTAHGSPCFPAVRLWERWLPREKV